MMGDMRSAVLHRIGSISAWREYYRLDGRDLHPDEARELEVWDEMLVLFDKLEYCKADIASIFNRRLGGRKM